MSQAGVYSENKLIWWAAREGLKLPDAPKQVQLILSDLCNQDCSFCAYRMSGYSSNELFVGDSPVASYGHQNPKRWIPTPRALSLIDEMKEAGVLSVQFTGGGEPTVHPEHEAVFVHAMFAGLRCALVSNGVRWSDRLIENILPSFDWVRVSIDAGNDVSYATIRNTPQKNWDQVWRNVHRLAKRIEELESPTTLGIGFVVTPDNFDEIPAFALKARESGAHNARLSAMFSPESEKPFLRYYDHIRALIDHTKESLETEDFVVHDNFGSRFDDLKQHAPDYSKCSYQHYTAYIGGDMKAYRCCVLAYNQRGLVAGGDLKTRSFKEFWGSQERKDDMAALDAKGCERCQFNAKNKQFLYVTGNTESDTSPRHMEWP